MKSDNIQAVTAAAVMTMGVLNSPAANTDTKLYSKIGDSQGSATDKTYKDWIDALGWAWGIRSRAKERGLGTDQVHGRHENHKVP